MAFIEYVDRPRDILPTRLPPPRLAAEEVAVNVEAVASPVDIDSGMVAEPVEKKVAMDRVEKAAVAGEAKQISHGQSQDPKTREWQLYKCTCDILGQWKFCSELTLPVLARYFWPYISRIQDLCGSSRLPSASPCRTG